MKDHLSGVCYNEWWYGNEALRSPSWHGHQGQGYSPLLLQCKKRWYDLRNGTWEQRSTGRLTTSQQRKRCWDIWGQKLLSELGLASLFSCYPQQAGTGHLTVGNRIPGLPTSSLSYLSVGHLEHGVYRTILLSTLCRRVRETLGAPWPKWQQQSVRFTTPHGSLHLKSLPNESVRLNN